MDEMMIAGTPTADTNGSMDAETPTAEMEYDNEFLSGLEEGTETLSETPTDEDENAEEFMEESSSEEEMPSEVDTPENEQEKNKVENAEEFVITHLGTEHRMSKEAVTQLAQKGMNYDYVKSDRDGLKQQLDNLNNFIGAEAKAFGMTIPQYLSEWQLQREAKAISENMKAKGEAVSDGVAREMARLSLNQKKNQPSISKEFSEKRKAALSKELMREVDSIKSEFGVNELPAEVIGAIAKGQRPMAAYHAHKAKELENKVQILEKNSENAKKAVPARKNEGSAVPKDAFLEGLFG